MKTQTGLWEWCITATVIVVGAGLARADSWEQLEDGPGGRAYHTTVFSGDYVIVWGGGRNGSFLNDGGRFNLNEKAWQAVSLENAPSSRWFQGAAWTGKEMIIWGGRASFSFSGHSTDGGRYDPKLDRWSSMSALNAPSPRSQFATVWTGREMIVWGGLSDGGAQLSDGGRYDPERDAWTPLAACPLSARFEQTAVWSGTEMSVFGGLKIENEIWSSFGDGARYDPRTERWTLLNPKGAPSSRTVHTAVWTGNEMLIWGGRYLPDTTVLQTGASYDPVSDSWTAIPTDGAPAPRAGHAAVWSGNGMIVWGGWDAANDEMNSGGRYNPISKTWLPTTLENAPDARFFNAPHSAVWTGHAMFIYGGFDYPVSLNSAHLYYPASVINTVQELIDLLNSFDLPRRIQRPLLATLDAAEHSLDQSAEKAAANQLQAFQQKVQAQLGRQYPEVASSLIEAAQAIINRLRGADQ